MDEQSILKAVIENGELKTLMEPEYQGDSMGTGGSLYSKSLAGTSARQGGRLQLRLLDGPALWRVWHRRRAFRRRLRAYLPQ
jgi:hypothetical protein